MTKRQRAFLFSICAILFVSATLFAIFYSQGYRLDLGNKRVTQTGAFYFKVLPKGAQVYLDGQPKKKTDFLFGAAFIENLLPKRYNVQIKKDGYFTWEKTLEIKERQVTEAKNVVLIPQSPAFGILTKNAADFFFTPDEKKIILKEIKETGWELKLYDLKNNIKSHLMKSTDIAKNEVELFDVMFSSDSKRVLLKVGLGENLKYYLFDLDKTPAVLSSLDFLGKGVEDVVFNPKDSQKLYFLKERKLAEADLTKKAVSPTLLDNIFAWKIFDASFYYLEKSGYLFKTDFSFTPREKINSLPFPLKEETEYEIDIFPHLFFLKDNEDLYFLNIEAKGFEKIFNKVKAIKESPDSKKIVCFTDSEIWILFLEKEEGQPQKSAGEKLFLTRLSEKIGDVFWFGSHYLIFNSEDKIKISEIDERDKINIYDLTEFKTPEIYFNQTDKKLYLLSEGNFFSSEKIIP